MKRNMVICLTLLWVGLSHANGVTSGPTRGTIVVGGNQLTGVDSLQVVDGKIFVGKIQVWPAVPRTQPMIPSVDPATAALYTNIHGVNLAVGAKSRELLGQGYGIAAVAESCAATFRSFRTVVDNAWVDKGSGEVWVRWKTGQTEEVLMDRTFGSRIMLPDPALQTAKLWRGLLARGCTIYVGDGYEVYVPALRFVATQEKFSRLLADSASVVDPALAHFHDKYAEVLRDLRSPQPLDSLRTGR